MKNSTTDEPNSKINEKNVRDFYAYFNRGRANSTPPMRIDHLKVFQSILSRKLPSERYNGVVNFFYIISYLNATTEEIENTLVIRAQIK